MATDRVELIRRMLEDNDEDGKLFSSELRSSSPWDRLRKGVAASENFRGLDQAFQGARVTVLEAHESGDTVVVRWRFRGTLSGEIPGIKIKAAGQKIDITGTNTYRFVGARVVDKTGEFDVGGFHADACEQVQPAECVQALNVIATRAR